MYRIKDHALSLDKIGRDLRSDSDRVIEHLLKIFYFRDSTGDYSHWSSEVYAFVHFVPKIKKSNKAPKKGFIKKNLWDYKKDVFSIIHKKLLEDFIEDIGTVLYDSRAAFFCEDYMEWLSEALSLNNVVSFKEVKTILDTLVKRYPV